MKKQDTSKLALSLMKEFGLFAKGWEFRFDQATRRFGCCHYNKRIISISEPISLLNDENHVRNTILHEIAHALAGHKAGHSRVWQRTAVSIGCTGERLYNSAVVAQPVAKFAGKCPNCKHVYQTQRRNRTACGFCCRAHNHGKFSAKYLIQWSGKAI